MVFETKNRALKPWTFLIAPSKYKARGNPRTQIAWRREDGKPIRLCHPQNKPGGGGGSRSRGGDGGGGKAKEFCTIFCLAFTLGLLALSLYL